MGGTAQPYMLTIETGASDTAFELGGLPLTRLIIKLGAGKNVLRFSEPNPRAMSVFDLAAGVGSIEIFSLANATFADMRLDGGAARMRAYWQRHGIAVLYYRARSRGHRPTPRPAL
jgi:hypothetical protein